MLSKVIFRLLNFCSRSLKERNEVIFNKLQIDSFSLLAFTLSGDGGEPSLPLPNRLLNPTKVWNQIFFFWGLCFSERRFGLLIKEIRLFKWEKGFLCLLVSSLNPRRKCLMKNKPLEGSSLLIVWMLVYCFLPWSW